MVKFCSACGSVNTPDSRYCSKCGAALPSPVAEDALSAPQPEDEVPLIPSTEPDPVSASPRSAVAYPSAHEEPERRNWRLIGVIAGAIVLIGALYFFLFVADDMDSGGGGEYGNSVEDGGPGDTRQMFTLAEVNIRDKPTTAGSTILGKLPRGSAITGVVKMGEDGKTEWLQLVDGKGFVAISNLSETEPPEITKALNGQVWTADSAVDIWSAPDTTSTLLDQVGEGTKLTLSGLTANNFIEIRLRNGSVGYIADGEAVLARLGGKPIAISFNPQSCNFGPELEAEFAKINARMRAQWMELENKEFVDDAAREKAYGAMEGRSSYVRLKRSYEGLSLTAIAQHYESQSLYFADPPAKVAEVFRSLGFVVGRDGTFPSTELYAGISATRGEGAAYGKSELGCGV